MKTKILLLALSVLFITVSAAYSQTLYYQTESQYRINDDFTVKCDYRGENKTSVVIRGLNDLFTYAPWTARDGGPLPMLLLKGYTKPIIVSSEMRTKAWQLINESFTAEQKAMLKGKELAVRLRVNPDNGAVWEVFFEFWKDSPFMMIPPETYYAIMEKLKRNVSFEMTEAGRNLNYGIVGWGVEIK